MRTGHTFQRLRLAMLGLGGTVGLAFPSVAYYGFGVDTAETISFHVLCITTGLLVGALHYALFYGVVDRNMSEIAARMGDHTEAYARGELLVPPVVHDEGDDALAKMQHAFAALAGVVTDQLENERIARSVVDALSATVDLEETCGALLKQLREICGASIGIVYVRTPAGWEQCSSIGLDTTHSPAILEADSPLALAAMEGPHEQEVTDRMRWLRVPTLVGSIVPNRVYTFPVWSDGEPVALVTYAHSGEAPDGIDAKLTMIEREAGVHIANARLHHQLSELAAVDELTELLNRRFGQRRLSEAHSLAGRIGTTLGVAMFDIDHFKRFNDTHGHAAGDAVLAAVGRALSDTVRDYDTVIRWGGEEILLVSPDTDPDAMDRLAERLRKAVEALSVDWQGQTLKVTVSVGTATGRGAQWSAEALVARADEALYTAKANGRNRVVRHGDSDKRVSLVPDAASASA